MFKNENKDLIMADGSRKAWDRFEEQQKFKPSGLGNPLVWAGFSAYWSCFKSVVLIPCPETCVLRHSLNCLFLLNLILASSL